MIKNEEAAKHYLEARKAIRNGNDPVAFLNLGRIYTQGIGITPNHALASYFFKKALAMGCEEAEDYIDQEYTLGYKTIVTEVRDAFEDGSIKSPDVFAIMKKKVEKERISGNYGNLSKLRKYLDEFYPDYDEEKGISDLLNNQNTIDADLYYSTCTTNNYSEILIDLQESILSQLFAPISEDEDIWKYIQVDDLGESERELAQCLVNLTSSYEKICEHYEIEPIETFTLETLGLFPYIKVPSLVQLRRQALRCVLSIKDIDPNIRDKYLNNLDDDEELLNICEAMTDQDIQLFLISFVELNLDIEALQVTSLSLLHSYHDNNFDPLAKHLRKFVDRLTAGGIKHHLPEFTTDNLPPIEIQ